jgi:hypothetical protein
MLLRLVGSLLCRFGVLHFQRAWVWAFLLESLVSGLGHRSTVHCGVQCIGLHRRLLGIGWATWDMAVEGRV